MKKKFWRENRGIALIIIVFLFFLLSVVAISEMLLVTGTQLSETNLGFAVMNAESTAIMTSSPSGIHCGMKCTSG